MGQKTHPIGYRLGFTKTWNAKWYANHKAYPVLLKEDVSIRTAIRSRLRDAAIARRAASIWRAVIQHGSSAMSA